MPDLTLSVIIPTYNDGQFLDACITSVKAQTLQVSEIIVIDDGSSDTVACEALRHVSERHPEVLLIRQTNAGPAAARNRGLRQASGDLIAFVDADDRLRADCLSGRYTLIKNDPRIVAAFGGFEGLLPDGTTIRSRFRDLEPQHLPFNDIGKPDAYPGGLPLWLFRAAPLRIVGELDETLRIMEDFDLILRLARHGGLVAGNNLPSYLRTLRANSLSRSSVRRRYTGVMTFLAKARSERYFTKRELARRYCWETLNYIRRLAIEGTNSCR